MQFLTYHEDGVGQGGEAHAGHGAGQQAGHQPPRRGPGEMQLLRGVQVVVLTVLPARHQQHLETTLFYSRAGNEPLRGLKFYNHREGPII